MMVTTVASFAITPPHALIGLVSSALLPLGCDTDETTPRAADSTDTEVVIDLFVVVAITRV